MTRFARIHTRNKSSGSFSKVPEEATSWAEFKMQMEVRRDNNDDLERSTDSVSKETSCSNELQMQDDNLGKSSVNKEPTNIHSTWCDFENCYDGKVEKKNKKRKSKSNEDNKDENAEFENDDQVLGGKVKSKKKEKRKTFDDGNEECLDMGEESLAKVKKNKKRKNKHTQEDNDKVSVTPGSGDQEDVEQNLHDKSKSNFKKKNKTVQEDLSVIVDGKKEKMTKYGGFYILQIDADRIQKLKEKMIKEGRSKAEIDGVIRRHRRNAEKSLGRKKKKMCFHCRDGVHLLSDCPKLDDKNGAGAATGVCYKCGSTEHNLYQCKEPGNELKFAKCFICNETGHLSKQCPDNPRGLYPNGGSCRICGDVTHLKRDCPELIKKKRDNTITVGTIGKSIEGLDEDHIVPKKFVSPLNSQKRVNKIIKFD